MSIPKVIHYCWFGRKPLPKEVKHCIASWRHFCPDYEIKQWNEDNFDCSQNLYAWQALKAKKWAFASDYARLKIIYDYGGIYLDTDVELIRPLDDLLELEGFMGFEPAYPGTEFEYNVATGLGFGAQQGSVVIGRLLSDYDEIAFLKPDGSLDCKPCSERNTETFVQLGLQPNAQHQNIKGIEILPLEFFCPFNYITKEQHITENTYSIHHYSGSWVKKQPALIAGAKGRLRKYAPYSYALLKKIKFFVRYYNYC